MIELDAAQVLSIPRRIKSQEVVLDVDLCQTSYSRISAMYLELLQLFVKLWRSYTCT